MPELPHSIVPHLTTALSGPLTALEKTLLAKQTQIEVWFRKHWLKSPPPLNSSVDLRNAGFKLAPVDTNLFPAGFNNLAVEFMPMAIQAAQATMSQYYPDVTKILIVPESHTRNVNYFESLAMLQSLLKKAGFEVRIGSLLDILTKPKEIELPSGRKLTLEPVEKMGDKLQLADYDPCLIWLNNDLLGGVPAQLQDLAQPINPPLQLGWSSRFKSQHFAHYHQVAEEFAELIGIDPWLITPLHRVCPNVDFVTSEGETCLVEHTQQLLEQITQKYQQYGIEQKPFVVIKADFGTYGMNVMMVQDVETLRNLTHKQRSKMESTKGQQKVSQVLIQEGVYTFETLGDQQAVAEPVVYMLGQHVIGGFYRVHKNRGQDENLNAPGMHFEPLAFVEACNNPQPDSDVKAPPNRFYTYGVIARLACLAAALEYQEVLS